MKTPGADGAATGDLRVTVSLSHQQLRVWQGRKLLREYPVSTGRNGPGERNGSGCTPRGEHVIAEKFGAGSPPDTVFVGRRPTGEIYDPALRARFPDRDWIVTRILWLSGCQAGVNQGGDVDTHDRYIYIHGSPGDVPMGEPGSAGCIRMQNADVVELFDMLPVGAPVLIEE